MNEQLVNAYAEANNRHPTDTRLSEMAQRMNTALRMGFVAGAAWANGQPQPKPTEEQVYHMAELIYELSTGTKLLATSTYRDAWVKRARAILAKYHMPKNGDKSE